MRKLIALLVVVLVVTVVGASLALAQDEQAEPDVVVEAVVVEIDGVSRTVTVTFVPTGVLSVEVGPVVGDFVVTGTVWLDDLNAALADVKIDDQELDMQGVYTTLDALLAATEATSYPAYYIPFVRQYRFAIHSCRLWLRFHEGVTTNEENGGIFMVGPYLTLQSACFEQYQDAYVEMERIAHPRSSADAVVSLGDPRGSVEVGSEEVDDLGLRYVLLSGDDRLTLTEWTVYENGDGDLEFAGEVRNASEDERLSLADVVVRFYRADGRLLKVETFVASGRWVGPGEVYRFEGSLYEELGQIDHYEIEIIGRDWRAATE